MVTTKNAAGTTLFYTVRNYADGDGDDQTTNRVSGYACRNGNGGILNYNTYAYDEAGNIIQINQVLSNGSRVLARYSYDCQNQLTQEIRYSYSGSSLTGTATTINYTYDTAGNLLDSYADGATWVTYAYADDDWADLLTSVNVNGTSQTISYDGGNPTNWYNGSSYSGLTWQQGRRLASLSKGSTSISYTYDIEGIRTSKTVGNTKYEYVTQNGKVVREYVSNASTGAFIRCLDFFYDTNGQPFAMRKYRTSALTTYDTYHYVLNAQGDVVQINYQGGTVYATYTYDAWGRVLSATGTLAEVNPLRYRGYYYDTETGWYYLQSRYYDPIVKRFLNADAFASTGQGFLGYNMFAYGSNNPIILIDESGSRAVAVQMTDGGGGRKKYDRTAAIEYAKEWYDSYNDSYYHYSTDCANFVSQCLAAGGIEQTDEWHMKKTEKTWWYDPRAWLSSKYRYDWDVGPAWSVAPNQYKYFSAQSGNTTIHITSASDISNVALTSGVQAGDLLYFATDSGIHHATIISKVENGMIYYAGHTNPRFDEPLADNMGSDTVYIIKIGY